MKILVILRCEISLPQTLWTKYLRTFSCPLSAASCIGVLKLSVCLVSGAAHARTGCSPTGSSLRTPDLQIVQNSYHGKKARTQGRINCYKDVKLSLIFSSDRSINCRKEVSSNQPLRFATLRDFQLKQDSVIQIYLLYFCQLATHVLLWVAFDLKQSVSRFI